MKILQFIKIEKCFKYKEKEHIIYNCLEKTKVSTILVISNIDNIKIID